MRSHRLSWIALVLSVTACGVFSADDPKTEPGGSSGGPAAPPEENAKPPGVDGKPLEGVFVSASKGNDQNDGSMTKPLATLAAGLRKGQIEGKRVLVCAETYAETLAWIDGVSAYGYFDCGAVEWKLDESKRATIASPKSPAVRVEAAVKPTRIEGFQIVAPDFGAGSPDEREPFQNSSVGVFVKSSSALTISKSTIRAGKGRDGIDGAVAPSLTANVLKSPEKGLDEETCVPGGGVACVGAGGLHYARAGGGGGTAECTGGPGPIGTGPGGAGGDAGHWDDGNLRTAPSSGLPAAANAQTARGGLIDTGGTPPYRTGTAGDNGAAGAAGNDGTNGGLTFGELGPAVGDGSNGTDGKPGQGGGGGSAMSWARTDALHRWGGAGGGGGAGGCPGLAGGAGRGGGGSIAIYSVSSSITLERSDVRAAAGGRAGRGSLGSPETAGQVGALGGVPVPNTQQCTTIGGLIITCYGGKGGDGGPGGRSGVSGHGAAGPSIGVVHIGDAPKMDADTVITPGAGGAGQGALSRGGATVPAAPQGASEKILKAQ
ncbi:MAG: hypothetical protein JNL38_04300 [Myxococcales bacterium]|nr:hypothetical protein [Myxococcales bacterium]